MIYLSMICVLGVLGFATYFCVAEYLVLRSEPQDTDSPKFNIEKIYDLKYMSGLEETWLCLSIIIGLIFIIMLLVILFLRKRIQLAAELIKEVSKAITSIPSALFWPIIPFVLVAGVVFYCGIFVVFY